MSMSPGRETEAKVEFGEKEGEEEEEEEAIDWTGFAVGGGSDNSGGGGGGDVGVGGSGSGSGNGAFTEHIGPLEKTPAEPAARATPFAPEWHLPTPSATQSQQTQVSNTDTNPAWLVSTLSHQQRQQQHQRNPSVASSTAWPDTEDPASHSSSTSAAEEEDETIVHKRMNSVDSVAYFSESQSQPGSVRRSSVVTTTPGGAMMGGKGGKGRKRILDILPADYESRRTLFDGVVPPRAESPPAGMGVGVGEEVRTKRKGKRKNVGFAGVVEEIPMLPSRSSPLLAKQEEEHETEQLQPQSENCRFPSSPPAPLPHKQQPQQKQQQGHQQGPHTPTPAHTSTTSFLPDLFVPKRRYIEVARQKVQSRRAPDLARCRVASVVLQRAVLGDMGGRDGGGVPREFGGYLFRVDENTKGKERALESEGGAEGEMGVLVRRGVGPAANSLAPGASGAVRCGSPTEEVSYPILPARRRISGLGLASGAAPALVPVPVALASNESGNGNSTPGGSSGFRKSAMAMSTPSRYGGGDGAGTNARNTPNRGSLSSVQAAAVIKDTISNARAFSGATGRGPGGSASLVATPMRDKDLRANLLETLARSRRMLGMRRSVTPEEGVWSPLQVQPEGGKGVMVEQAPEAWGEEKVLEEGMVEEKIQGNIIDEGAEPEVDIDGLIQEQLIKQIDERRSVEIERQRRFPSQEPQIQHQQSPVEVRAPSASAPHSPSPPSSIPPSRQPTSSPAPLTLPPPMPATPATRHLARRAVTPAVTPATIRVTRSMSTRSSVEVEEKDIAATTPASTHATLARTTRASTIPIDESPAPVLIPPSVPVDTPAPSRRPARGVVTRQRMTLEERWAEERRENVRRAREGAVVVDDDEEGVVETEKESVVVIEEEEDEEEEGDDEDEGYILGVNEEGSEEESSSSEDGGEELGEEENEEVVDMEENLHPTATPKYAHANNPVVEEYMEVEQQEDEEATAGSTSDESDSAEDDEPLIFPRRGIIRKQGISPARGINMASYTPIRKPPIRVPVYNHAAEEADEESATPTSSETEDSSKEEPIVYPRRGILRKPGAGPAVGINMSPASPIRYAPRESRWGIEGYTPPQVVLGRAYLARGQPAWTPRDLRLGEWRGKEESVVEGEDEEDEEGEEEEEGEGEEGEVEVEEEEEEEEEEEGEKGGGDEDEEEQEESEEEEAEEADVGSEMDTMGGEDDIPPASKPGIAARLFRSLWGGNSHQEPPPTEPAQPNPHAHRSHSHSQNWATPTSPPSYNSSDHHQQLTRPDAWLPHHRTLLDHLMQELPPPSSAPASPPRAPARYDMFKRNWLWEISHRNPAPPRSLRIPILNIHIPLPLPLPLPPSRNWRPNQHPLIQLDDREKAVAGRFVQEARARFGEDWSGAVRESAVEKMVRRRRLGNINRRRDDDGLGINTPRAVEDRRRIYYSGIGI